MTFPNVPMSVFALAAYLLFASAFTMLVYGLDKRRAVQDGWRVPERVLLFLALLGGSPGAKLGQWVLRHKTRKQPFGVLLNMIVVVQIVAVVAVTVPVGNITTFRMSDGVAMAMALFAPAGSKPEKVLPHRFGPGS